MGRCNNRRAQQAAAQAQNVPSRARFSKRPPTNNKRGGRGRGREGRSGRSGGSGGRITRESVINKISQRVEGKQRDASSVYRDRGGISVSPSSAGRGSRSDDVKIHPQEDKMKDPLMGLDKNKLDEVTFSQDSIQLVTEILTSLGIMTLQKHTKGKTSEVSPSDSREEEKSSEGGVIRNFFGDDSSQRRSASSTASTSSSKLRDTVSCVTRIDQSISFRHDDDSEDNDGDSDSISSFYYGWDEEENNSSLSASRRFRQSAVPLILTTVESSEARENGGSISSTAPSPASAPAVMSTVVVGGSSGGGYSESDERPELEEDMDYVGGGYHYAISGASVEDYEGAACENDEEEEMGVEDHASNGDEKESGDRARGDFFMPADRVENHTSILGQDKTCSKTTEDLHSVLNDFQGDIDINDDKGAVEEEKPGAALASPLFLHLTTAFSFTVDHASQACRAIEDWTDGAYKDENEDNDGNSVDGTLDHDRLALAMDWLCLHLTEEELKCGFRRQATRKAIRPKGAEADRTLSPLKKSGCVPMRAVPHESISVVRLARPNACVAAGEAWTNATAEDDSVFASRHLGFVRLGFHEREIKDACERVGAPSSSAVVAEDEDGVLRVLLRGFLEEIRKKGSLSQASTMEQSKEADLEFSAMEREEEKFALQAIFAENFKCRRVSAIEGEDDRQNLERYIIQINSPENLHPPARAEECRLHVFTTSGYPVLDPPLLLVTNPTLPPSLLRKANVELLLKAMELVGQPAVFLLAEYLTERLPMLQEKFVTEQRQKEMSVAEERKRVRDNAQRDEMDLIMQSQYEDPKKLGRRQRAKLKAAERAFDRHIRDAEQDLERAKKQEERIAQAQAGAKTFRMDRAEKILQERERARVEEEAEKAKRDAMLTALNAGKTNEEARKMAELAKKQSLFNNCAQLEKKDDEEEENKKEEEENATANNATKASSSSSKAKGMVSGRAKDDGSRAERDESSELTVPSCVDDLKQRKKDENACFGEKDGDEALKDNGTTALEGESHMGPTRNTLEFAERLRRFYLAATKEKEAAVASSFGSTEKHARLDDKNTNSRFISTEPARGSEMAGTDSLTNKKDCKKKQHVPAPVFAPTQSLTHVMKDVITVQSQQPWLVSPDARAPTLDVTSTEDGGDRLKREEVSATMRKKLADIYKSADDWGRKNKKKGRAGHSGAVDGNRKCSFIAEQFFDIMSQRSRLPAYAMRESIVGTIEENQITVISGDTGCGKTTQVPQLVLDDLIWKSRGAEANIIVTQPRRISAIGVCERMAQERCENVGDTVGYSIRFESRRSSKTRILLCTTGVLLRRLQCDPDLASVSHVFVDEVHERDLNTDFLLIILKDLLTRRKALKLVLMSATLNANTFSSYFGGCPMASIPGRTHPVQERRLEDILQLTGYEIIDGSEYAIKENVDDKRDGKSQNPLSSTNKKGKKMRLSRSELKRVYDVTKYSKTTLNSLAIVDECIINYELLATLVEYITLNNDEGAILVFLPGFMEITKAIEEFRKKDVFMDSSRSVIYPLHSSLSTAEQTSVFDVPPSGVRKIVVSTNIAETSITIEDVVYVVDSGRVKENRQDEVAQMPMLVECWVSRASAKQRRGRAGRVRPGIAYHMYSSHTFTDVLEEYQLPEMLRVGLEDLVLQVLLLDLGEPSVFLTKAVNPPSALAIRNSLKLLEGLGAVECDWDRDLDVRTCGDLHSSSASLSTPPQALSLFSCESLTVKSDLTALGFHLASLPVDPRVGKMMIYGALFRCIDPALTIAASMTARNPFVCPFDYREEADAAKSTFATEGSDHLTTLTAFNIWRDIARRGGGRREGMFLRENFLSRMTLEQIDEMRHQFADLLVDTGFLHKDDDRNVTTRRAGRRGVSRASPAFDDTTVEGNENSHNLHLIKAILCAGLYPNIIIGPRDLTTGTSEKTAGEYPFASLKGNVYLHPSTIAFKAKQMSSRYHCYHEILKTSKVYVRDCTAISEFALLLFGGNLKVYHVHGVVTVDEWLKFRISAKPATLVKHLRAQMEKMLLRKIVNPAEDVTGTAEGKALIQAISALLQREVRNVPQESSTRGNCFSDGNVEDLDRSSKKKALTKNENPQSGRGRGKNGRTGYTGGRGRHGRTGNMGGRGKDGRTGNMCGRGKNGRTGNMGGRGKNGRTGNMGGRGRFGGRNESFNPRSGSSVFSAGPGGGGVGGRGRGRGALVASGRGLMTDIS